MTFRTETYFNANWHIDALTTERLLQQEVNGWYKSQERIYMGNTDRLERIRHAYELLLPTLGEGMQKLFVRRSCIDSTSKKFTVVEIYLSHKSPTAGRTVYEATWTAPGRDPDSKIVHIIGSEFDNLLHTNNFDPSSPIFTEGFEV